MELTDSLLEDRPASLDIFGSLWLNALGASRANEGWTILLKLTEHLCLDLLSHMDFLLEHRAVCLNVLGPMYADDPYVWLFLNN